MSWFEEQLETRKRLDDEQVAEAYERIARSVVGSKHAPRVTMDDVAATDSAVAAVLRYFGKTPSDVPNTLTDPSERMDYAVRSCGMMKRKVTLEGRWWTDATGAYLGQLKTGEPIAIIPLGLRSYGYVEPVTNKKVLLTARTAADVLPEAYCFYRPLPEESLTVRDLVRFMVASLDAGDYIRIALATLAVSLVGMLPAVANNLLFDRIIPSGEMALILPICALLLGAVLASTLIGILRSMVTTRLSSKLSMQMEAAMMARVLSLPPAFFKSRQPGELAKRVRRVSSIVDTLTSVFLGSGLTAVFSLVYIGQIVMYAPSLVVPALAIIAAQVVVGVAVTTTQAQIQRRIVDADLKVSGLVPALLNGITKVKLTGAEKRAFAQWADVEADYLAAQYDLPLWRKVADTMPTLVALVGTIVIYWFAGSSGVSLADFMAFNVAYGAVSGAIVALAHASGRIAQVRSYLDAVRPILEAVPESALQGKQVTSLSGSIELAGVTFRYDEAQPPVLEDLSLKVKSGEYLAIVGKSGSGKSTVLRLLLGFEKPERGAVYYGGQDIADMDARSLRRVIGVCLQNGTLLAGSIFNNIVLASPRATMDDAWEAAELAGIGDDIRAMPMGMHTLITEGTGGVSGGQRQRILIARAVCSKPRVLIFDEATSALDNVTQKHVSDSLSKLKCTRIVVAHRLSTIKLADRIVMLDGGHIVEEGTYDELVAAGGAFADLVKRQQLESESA
ncbi:MAG: ATP-binding cassette domain-containing protein [Eggerthellaceae bacterium]|nr:ATP-binding cassette domain-containing protein [Eggerthellaceae bacterium]